MADILLVYYSHTGFTRQVARDIADAVSCDVEELKELKQRRGYRGLIRAFFDSILKTATALQATEYEPEDYTLVVVGGPIWIDDIPPPVRSYMLQHRGKFKNVAWFCTCKSMDPERAAQNLGKLARTDVRAQLIVMRRELESLRREGGHDNELRANYHEKIVEFAHALGAIAD